MAVFRCKMCGADLSVFNNNKVVECDFCGTQQTIPAADDEKKVNLFNRANNMRMHCEFDKASAIYENLISEFFDEAEAYWGLCLCKYGIEYVDDPKTKKKVPTLHRASKRSIMEDEDYKTALEKSDVIAREQYKKEAAEIDRLNEEINEISRKEKPYDIFICYKETDEDGERTRDSVIAQDIYDALTKKGYKVFFARITLEDKLGEKYEPYIFSALNTAKVMLVFGTKPEYFNAVWVRNEWSRYLDIVEHDHTKKLFPCYKNMDAYDLPIEFKNLQAQDMSKVGFEQDLVRNIGKIIPLETEKPASSAPGLSQGDDVEFLTKNAKKMIELNNYPGAEKLFTRITETYPDNFNGWWGRILCLTKSLTSSDFKWDEFNLNYNTLKQVADEDTMLDLNAQLSVFFKEVLSAEYSGLDRNDWKNGLARSKEKTQEIENDKSSEIEKANRYTKSCNDAINEYINQKNTAETNYALFNECCIVRQKARTTITVLMVVMIILPIIVLAAGFSGDATTAGVFVAILIIAEIIMMIMLGINLMRARVSFNKIGIKLKNGPYGKKPYGSLGNRRLIEFIESSRDKAHKTINDCVREINDIGLKLEDNNKIVQKNLAYFEELIKTQNKYTARLERALALPEYEVAEYEYCELCKRYDIDAPDIGLNTLNKINFAYNAIDIMNGETDEEYVMLRPSIGKNNDEGEDYGGQVEPVEETAKTAAKGDVRVCPECGNINSPDTKFCEYCGSKIAELVQNNA